MNRASKLTPLLRSLSVLLLILALVFFFWTIFAYLFLPLNGVEKPPRSRYTPLPHFYRIASNKALHRPAPLPQKPMETPKSNLRLLAVYKGPHRDLAVIERRGKSYVVRTGEEVAGYRLKSVGERSVLLEKRGQEYRLELKEPPHLKGILSSPTPQRAPSSIKEIRQEGDTTFVPRTLIRDYSHNLDKIWRNIGIDPEKKGNELVGFRVRFVRWGSPFEKLGLRRGDIITAINGEPLRDLGTVMEVYRSIDSMDGLTLTVKRNNKEVELNYEIQ